MTEKDLDTAIEKCERIMEFDTRTLKNPDSENGYIFEKVYDLLKFLRQFEFETGGMDDLISRQAAIDVADAVWSVTGDKNVAKVWDQIKDLPSVQPVVISKSENATECEDAVSREAILNEIHRYMEERDYTIGLLDDNVCGLPPVTPKQPGWIPCSERLPKLSGYYLTTMKWEEDFYEVDCYEYDSHYKEWNEGECYGGTVVAWCELPTPYREGGQDNTDCPLKEISLGHWTDKGSLSCRCSECGCKSPKEYPYCPNCGTPMEK